MLRPDQVLIHGLFAAPPSSGADSWDEIRLLRRDRFLEHGDAMGVSSFRWYDGRRRALMNRMLRKMRGTAAPVDAVEVIELDQRALRESLAGESGRGLWREAAACVPDNFDPARSFILIGAPRRLLEHSDSGTRVLWFGNGLAQLSRDEFIRHYTEGHGPLVAGHAEAIGLRNYLQVAAEQDSLCDSLRDCGLGQAPAPAVFAELVMGRPPLKLILSGARRAATREIEADEKRHIDFQRSMLLLPGP